VSTGLEPLLVVLDLDETLFHTTLDDIPQHAPDFRVGECGVYLRPHAREFLEDCFARFRVGVWTSATQDYADAILAEITAPERFEFVWARDRCKQRFHFHMMRLGFEKPLKKLLRQGYRRERILAVDDSPEKWRASYGNLVTVEPFFGDPNDQELVSLGRFLPTFLDCPDVRAVEKRNGKQSAAFEGSRH